ncbi:tripartite tricarboxylate transporter substrate-binding protein [Microvirga massiliensis]|uniref:tripartite tricarboxylate transporter substrate-binding protein n=1 Tax=Microvirga massiliensis TaxID=1033741 RepID=UPI00062B5B63|nr:tripartite tricarboxylate transporter substrate-binding protein [Microvirga massiliensis]
MKRLIAGMASAVLAAALTAGSAFAQSYPNRTITMIVPFAAGGPSDAIARLVAQSMSTTLKQQVVIENVAGAGGTTGASRLTRAEPDGYTLLIHHVALAAGASLYKSLPYDTLGDIEAVGLVNYGPMVVTTKKDYPAADAKALFAKLKADGPKTTAAHAGVGSNSHLCNMLLQQTLDTKFTEAAYRGTGPAMNDLMAGQVDLLCDQSTTAVPQIQGNTIKAFAVTSANRLSVLPDVPAMHEAGFPNFEFVIWHGLYAPKGTPKEAIETLNKALQVALNDENVKARFADVGTQTFPKGERSPQAHRARFEKEVATWRDVVAKAGVSIGN